MCYRNLFPRVFFLQKSSWRTEVRYPPTLSPASTAFCVSFESDMTWTNSTNIQAQISCCSLQSCKFSFGGSRPWISFYFIPTPQTLWWMECCPHSLFQIYTWERANRKYLQRGGPIKKKKNLEGKWTNHLSKHSIQSWPLTIDYSKLTIYCQSGLLATDSSFLLVQGQR